MFKGQFITLKHKFNNFNDKMNLREYSALGWMVKIKAVLKFEIYCKNYSKTNRDT